jgi:predicted nucleic acid-binding protein
VILIDTGPIVAAATPTDTHHRACLAALAELREPPLITAFCALEACYFTEVPDWSTTWVAMAVSPDNP